MLAWLIAIPILGGVAAWRAQGMHAHAPACIAVAALVMDLAVATGIALGAPGGEAWMALELVAGALEGVEGRVEYPPPFAMF